MENIVALKRCNICKVLKPVSEFWGKSYGREYVCNSCDRERRISAMAEYRHKARQEAIEHYGGKCACCGEDHPEFLAIDHINGGGNKHQKEIKGMAIGIWLRKHNYPTGFRVLCHNCNMSLGTFGYCPHNNLSNP